MGTDTPAHGHDPCKRRDALRRALAGWQLNVDNHDSRRLILVQEVHLQPGMNAASAPTDYTRRGSRLATTAGVGGSRQPASAHHAKVASRRSSWPLTAHDRS